MDPYREAAWRLKMRLAQTHGDHDRVIAAYRACESRPGRAGHRALTHDHEAAARLPSLTDFGFFHGRRRRVPMASTWLLLTNATVVDGAGNAPVLSVCAGEGLSNHGRRAHVSREMVPTGERLDEIDATGKTVMPGLIDAHCHMTYGESRSQEEIDLYTSPELRTLRAAFNAQKVLRAGVTSISQPGAATTSASGCARRSRTGIVQGPRMTSAGRYISTSNGLTDWYPDSVGVPEGCIGIVHNTLDPMIDEIRHQVKNGVDLIKLADSPFGDFQAFTDDEMKAMADLTHQLGKKITIHARGSSEVKAAVNAGIDWIMHGNIMDDETVGLWPSPARRWCPRCCCSPTRANGATWSARPPISATA